MTGPAAREGLQAPRIGFALGSIGRHPGGVRRYGHALADALVGEAGRRTAVFSVLGSETPAGMPLAKHWFAWRSRAMTADLVHFPNTYAPWFQTPFRKVVTVHDLTPLLFPWAHTWRTVAHHRVLFGRILHAADHLIAVSQATRRDLVRHGVPAGKISVVGEAAGPRFFAAAGRNPGRPGRYLLFCGAREPRKNIRGVIAAYRILRERFGVGWPLVIAGPAGWGPWREGDAEGVIWKGFVPETDLAELYREAALLVYPSFYEGFGLPVVEAMAAGTPVVTSDRGAIPEAAGDAALYADPARPEEIARACARLLADPVLWERISRRGMERARLFSWDLAAARTWDVYERTLGAHRN